MHHDRRRSHRRPAHRVVDVVGSGPGPRATLTDASATGGFVATARLPQVGQQAHIIIGEGRDRVRVVCEVTRLTRPGAAAQPGFGVRWVSATAAHASALSTQLVALGLVEPITIGATDDGHPYFEFPAEPSPQAQAPPISAAPSKAQDSAGPSAVLKAVGAVAGHTRRPSGRPQSGAAQAVTDDVFSTGQFKKPNLRRRSSSTIGRLRAPSAGPQPDTSHHIATTAHRISAPRPRPSAAGAGPRRPSAIPLGPSLTADSPTTNRDSPASGVGVLPPPDRHAVPPNAEQATARRPVSARLRRLGDVVSVPERPHRESGLSARLAPRATPRRRSSGMVHGTDFGGSAIGAVTRADELVHLEVRGQRRNGKLTELTAQELTVDVRGDPPRAVDPIAIELLTDEGLIRIVSEQHTSRPTPSGARLLCAITSLDEGDHPGAFERYVARR